MKPRTRFLRSHATCLLLVLVLLGTAPSARGEYGFPIENPYLATVLGTPPGERAPVPAKIDVQRRSLTLFPDRAIPEVFWSVRSFEYSLAAQKQRAPLVFLIAGTGARFDSEKNVFLQKVLYQAGMSVVNVSSPTHVDFIITASASSVPGLMDADVRDLYTALQQIRDDIADEVEVSEFYLAGYSLGATQSAFLGHLDQQEKKFDFQKILLINPAVSLYSSVLRLDNMVRENIPGGAPELQRLVERLFGMVADYFHTHGRQAVDEELLYHFAESLKLSDKELRALIGVSFRISLTRMLFTSEVMSGGGHLVEKDTELTVSTPLLPYLKAGARWSFTDYLDDVLLPYSRSQRPDLTRDELIHADSLAPIQDYLRRSERVAVITNEDEIILDGADVEFLRETFGERATIYPRGGHCGNLRYRENVERMLAFFRKPPIESQGLAATVSPPGPQLPTSVALRRITAREAAEMRGFLDVYDPIEGANRRIYLFNAGFDRYVFLPVVRGYKFIFPRFARAGVHNVFETLAQLKTLTNSLLQANPRKSADTVKRLGINLTVGVLGLWDAATRFGVPEHEETFDQTLGHWGVGTGPYFVIPLLGPSSARDATGKLVDRIPFMLLGFPPFWVAPIEGIDRRAHIPLRYGEVGVPFEYEVVRFLSRQREELVVPR